MTMYAINISSMKKSLKILIPVLISFVISLESRETVYKMERSMANITPYSVCNTDHIYDEYGGYEYSLPKGVLESFLSGKAFDHPKVYTDEESSRLHDDINELYQKITSKKPEKERLAVMTAGAPGAGKTIKMRQDLSEKSLLGRNFAYICPDDVCLKNQNRTYLADIARGDASNEVRQNAYNKWRPGSNAATHLILGNLIREKYAFYFGTTSSGPFTYKFFEFLKKQGYQIRLIHVTAPDEVRWESIKERDKSFVQTTKHDVIEKGLLLPQRINDTFLKYADEIEFYYRNGVNEDAKLAAKWVRNPDPSEALGSMHIVSFSRYEQIKAVHNAVTEVLKRPDLHWGATVEKNSIIHLP
jgi:predicted ABC-type ATPase